MAATFIVQVCLVCGVWAREAWCGIWMNGVSGKVEVCGGGAIEEGWEEC